MVLGVLSQALLCRMVPHRYYTVGPSRGKCVMSEYELGEVDPVSVPNGKKCLVMGANGCDYRLTQDGRPGRSLAIHGRRH